MVNNHHVLKDCKVLITGHTGFVGSWLALYLKYYGAELYGYSLPPDNKHSLYYVSDIHALFTRQKFGDIRDYVSFKDFISLVHPRVIIHLAARSIVSDSTIDPSITWQVNVQGTINLLESIRELKLSCVCLISSSDKCYSTCSTSSPIKESDPLGGLDPYSSSKSAVEILVSSWRYTFFPINKYKNHRVSIVTVRCGNIIGGGDWSTDRLIPDCVRAYMNNQPVIIRNPDAIRPWQIVFEPIRAFILIIIKQLIAPTELHDTYNIGPNISNHASVNHVFNQISCELPGLVARFNPSESSHIENTIIKIDISRSQKSLGWYPIYSLTESITHTIDWYKKWINKLDSSNMSKISEKYLLDYINKINFSI